MILDIIIYLLIFLAGGVVGFFIAYSGVNSVVDSTKSSAFVSDANSYQGVKEGLIYSSVPLDKNTISRIEKAISKKEGITIYLKPIVDQTLIGGVRVLINDHIYDSSIVSQIERMKRKILKNGG